MQLQGKHLKQREEAILLNAHLAVVTRQREEVSQAEATLPAVVADRAEVIHQVGVAVRVEATHQVEVAVRVEAIHPAEAAARAEVTRQAGVVDQAEAAFLQVDLHQGAAGAAQDLLVEVQVVALNRLVEAALGEAETNQISRSSRKRIVGGVFRNFTHFLKRKYHGYA